MGFLGKQNHADNVFQGSIFFGTPSLGWFGQATLRPPPRTAIAPKEASGVASFSDLRLPGPRR
jgi:hypothetical protein